MEFGLFVMMVASVPKQRRVFLGGSLWPKGSAGFAEPPTWAAKVRFGSKADPSGGPQSGPSRPPPPKRTLIAVFTPESRTCLKTPRHRASSVD